MMDLSSTPLRRAPDLECEQDAAGFHIDADGCRTTRRDGMDAYAYRCTVCGVVGDIDGGYFVPRLEVTFG